MGTNATSKRVLISTILPGAGGVPVMASTLVGLLRERGYEPVIAYYAPYSLDPALSVPSWKLLQRRPGSTRMEDVDGCETHAIGAWLPELEFTHYRATPAWRHLIASCAYHIGACGSAQALSAFHQLGLPFLGWIATGWEEDIVARGARYSTARRALQRTVIAPRMVALERKILRAGTILALSAHTGRVLNQIAGRAVTRAILPTPIDTDYFHPAPDEVDPHLIGFSGRLTEPRKNLPLLLQAMAHLKQNGSPATLALLGGELNSRTAAMIEELGIADRVKALGFSPRDRLAKQLRSFAAYIVPSHQEGLCIAALEAMASGAPVISTRCGGPSEYVIDGETGYLVDFDPRMMADRIHHIISDHAHRRKLSASARGLVEKRYGLSNVRSVFWKAFDSTFRSCGRSA